MTYGQTVTITATLSRSDGGGTVQSSTGGSNPIVGCARSPRPWSGSTWQAQCATSFAAGSYPLTVTYTGDSLYAAGKSTVLNLTVNPAPLVVTASSGSSIYATNPPTITAVVLGLRER